MYNIDERNMQELEARLTGDSYVAMPQKVIHAPTKPNKVVYAIAAKYGDFKSMQEIDNMIEIEKDNFAREIAVYRLECIQYLNALAEYKVEMERRDNLLAEINLKKKNDFLQAFFTEDEYQKMPKTFDAFWGQACRLEKSMIHTNNGFLDVKTFLYNLKQMKELINIASEENSTKA